MRAQNRTAILAAVAFLIVGQVYAAEAQKSSALRPLIQKALKTGAPTMFETPMAKLLGLEEMPCQHLDVEASSTTDGAYHQFHLLVSELSGAKMVPRVAVFERGADKGNSRDVYLFRTSLTGKLEAVALVVGKLDDQGAEIPGSGVVSHPPLDSPEVRALFQHELDFWLKNAYRKPKPKKQPR